MTRPSDLAPRSKTFDSKTGLLDSILLTRNNVIFHSDKSMSITLFGIKNDTNRSGFKIRIPKSDSVKCCPVDTLRIYLEKTSDLKVEGNPVFLTLTRPYRPIKSDTIAKILTDSINTVGLAGQGFTAKCFRPTAANAAVKMACNPDTAMHIGRWKSRDVFYDHYVHPMAPKAYTNQILQFEGLDYDNIEHEDNV
ncbi:hypothetical protein SNE40_022373 [Patella caerulea]